MFKPALVRLIPGKAELLSGMGIVKKLDSAVNLGGSIQCWEKCMGGDDLQ